MSWSKADKFKTRKQIPEFEENKNTSLEFKEHKIFFQTLFELRLSYSRDLAAMLNNDTPENRNSVLASILALIDWTNSQLSQRLEITKLKESILKAFTLDKTTKIYFELDKIYQKISEVHEETELIPKVKVTSLEESEYAKFWNKEENAAVRELKKAWADMFLIQ